MKKFNRVLALCLAVVMVLAMAACGGNTAEEEKPTTQGGGNEVVDATVAVEPGNDLSWLNTSGTMPIVAEGTEKSLSMYIWRQTGTPDLEETWMYQYVEEVMNINLDATKYTDENKSEFISLALASGELPDMIIGQSFSAADLVRYGAVESQFIDLAPYINETYMPNLTKLLEENPSFRDEITDSEGHIWSLGIVKDSGSNAPYSNMFINYQLLDEYGLEVPETIDDLLNVLRTFKENDPSCYPLGGSWVRHSPIDYLLNAFGYLITGDYNNGLKIALRNGEPVIPVADREAYGAFLEFMNTCYEEELIHPDFFTMDKATTEANMSEGKFPMYLQSPVFYLENYKDYWGALPLTSEYNDTPQWPASSSMSIGGVVVTSSCEEPELAAAFIDWFYCARNAQMNGFGPNAEYDADVLFGRDGWIVNEDGTRHQLYEDKVGSENYNDAEYVNSMMLIQHTFSFGCNVSRWDETSLMSGIYNFLDNYDVSEAAERRYEEGYVANTEQFRLLSRHATLGQYLTTDVYPNAVYFDAETAEEVSNLWVVVKDFATQETAKFITGARSLDEIDDYFDEIEGLGADDLLQYYVDAYNPAK